MCLRARHAEQHRHSPKKVLRRVLWRVSDIFAIGIRNAAKEAPFAGWGKIKAAAVEGQVKSSLEMPPTYIEQGTKQGLSSQFAEWAGIELQDVL